MEEDIRNLIFVERRIHHCTTLLDTRTGTKVYRVRIKVSTTRKNSLKVQSGNNKVIVPFHSHLDTIFRREHPS